MNTRGLITSSFLFFYLVVFGQTTIYEDLTLHSTAQLVFFNQPVNFFQGKITRQQTDDAYVIFDQAVPRNVSNDSHVEIPVLSRNQNDFIFPVGNDGVYQSLFVNDGDTNDLMVLFQRIAFDDLSLPDGIEFISNHFHWLVSGEKNAQVGLSWNTNSLLPQLTNELDALTILGYTAAGWEVIDSQITPFAEDGITPSSLVEGSIISRERIAFDRYDALTLGGIKTTTTLLVSQGLTPNGDNVNDTWYIENIERYPEVVIRVFNRWGGEVFYHKGRYNNDWNGSYKNNAKPLPEAPYYYRIDLENDGYIEHEGWIYINY